MNYKQVLTQSMNMLAKHDKTVFIGYNLKYGSQCYGTLKDVPKSKIIETPVAENLMTGFAIGMALEGYLPILIFERHDFMLNASDAIINHLSKIKQLSNGDFNPKVIIRAIVGARKPFYPGTQHTQDFTSFFENECNFDVMRFHNHGDVYEYAYKINDSIMIVEEREKYNEQY